MPFFFPETKNIIFFDKINFDLNFSKGLIFRFFFFYRGIVGFRGIRIYCVE